MTKNTPFIIKGNVHTDKRGSIAFCNDFDFPDIKRFYLINPCSTSQIRAWQGHKLEKKYFYAVKGSFVVQLIKPDNWELPNHNLMAEKFTLNAAKSEILAIPAGYINGFCSLEKDAQLLVYSSATLQESIADDYRWEHDYFINANFNDK